MLGNALGVLRRASRLFAIAAAAALALPSGSRVISRRLLFPVQDVAAVNAPLDVLEHRAVARDGVEVRLLELVVPGAERVIVHFHSNRETAAGTVGVARELAARGVGVLLVEYRGYGAHAGVSDAEPSEQGLYADAEAALDWLASRGVGPERIVLWGTSLGTGVAAEMARRGRGGRLVLVAPYTSIPDLVTDVVPFVPARALVPDHFDTLEKASFIHIPTVVVHGDADEIVPFRMGERVAGAIHGARLMRIAGGRHGDLWARARPAIVDALVEAPHPLGARRPHGS